MPNNNNKLDYKLKTIFKIKNESELDGPLRILQDKDYFIIRPIKQMTSNDIIKHLTDIFNSAKNYLPKYLKYVIYNNNFEEEEKQIIYKNIINLPDFLKKFTNFSEFFLKKPYIIFNCNENKKKFSYNKLIEKLNSSDKNNNFQIISLENYIYINYRIPKTYFSIPISNMIKYSIKGHYALNYLKPEDNFDRPKWTNDGSGIYKLNIEKKDENETYLIFPYDITLNNFHDANNWAEYTKYLRLLNLSEHSISRNYLNMQYKASTTGRRDIITHLLTPYTSGMEGTNYDKMYYSKAILDRTASEKCLKEYANLVFLSANYGYSTSVSTDKRKYVIFSYLVNKEYKFFYNFNGYSKKSYNEDLSKSLTEKSKKEEDLTEELKKRKRYDNNICENICKNYESLLRDSIMPEITKTVEKISTFYETEKIPLSCKLNTTYIYIYILMIVS